MAAMDMITSTGGTTLGAAASTGGLFAAANPLMLGLGVGGAIFGALSAAFGNDAIQEAADAQAMAAQIRAVHRRDEVSKNSRRNIGRLSAGMGSRNVFGNSQRRLLLDQVAQAASSEQSINADLSFRVLEIMNRAEANKTSIFEGAVSGFTSGIGFGSLFA